LKTYFRANYLCNQKNNYKKMLKLHLISLKTKIQRKKNILKKKKSKKNQSSNNTSYSKKVNLVHPSILVLNVNCHKVNLC